MFANKLIQPFFEYFLDKAIDDFINEPKQGLTHLEKISQDFNQLHLKDIILKLKQNNSLLTHLQKILIKTNKAVIRSFILNIMQAINKRKTEILHFDFRKSPPLQVNQIKNLLSKTEKIAYACFLLKDYPELEALVKLLQKERDTIFFIFLEPRELTSNVIEALSETENISLLLQADNLNNLHEANKLISKCHCLSGAYVFVNQENLNIYLNQKYFKSLQETEIAFLIYIRTEKLPDTIKIDYLKFLKENRFRYFPVFDFHEDQKSLINIFFKKT
ncbi:MAG: hypothetical protein ACOX43_05605 [Bacilli bacterium]